MAACWISTMVFGRNPSGEHGTFHALKASNRLLFDAVCFGLFTRSSKKRGWQIDYPRDTVTCNNTVAHW